MEIRFDKIWHQIVFDLVYTYFREIRFYKIIFRVEVYENGPQVV
jgi:hypothetical protein